MIYDIVPFLLFFYKEFVIYSLVSYLIVLDRLFCISSNLYECQDEGLDGVENNRPTVILRSAPHETIKNWEKHAKNKYETKKQ